MKKLETDIGIGRRLANHLQPLTVVIWLLISFGFPAIYYICKVTELKRTGTIYAEQFAQKIENLVIENPALWKYQNYKYNQIINNDIPQDKVATIKVVDEKGKSISNYEYTSDKVNKQWSFYAPIGSAAIISNNYQIGTVQVRLLQNTIVKETLVFLVLSSTLGTSLAILVYCFPIKIVAAMEGQIQSLIEKIQSSKAESDRLRMLAQASEQQFRDLVQGLDAIVWEADAAICQFSFVSQRAEELLGYPIAQWLTNTDFHTSYIHPDDRKQVVKLYRLAASQAKQQVIEYRAIAADGRVLWLRDLVQVVKGKTGQVQLLRGVTVDITKFKQAEEKLRHDAFHDVLTGLPNRALFMHRLEQAVELAKRHQDYLFAVLFLDLDRFKVINDSLGHKFGDQLLIEISRRLENCISLSDTVARLGGDEFVILLQIKAASDATSVAEQIKKELALPFNLSGNEVFAATSIGIALSKSYDSPENLLRNADTAMYHAKSLGKARYAVFDTTMHTQAVAMLQLERDLRRAVERQEFKLYYQPIVALPSGNIMGFEALIRWQHPHKGLVSPTQFIPLAEETGLIIPISEWVLSEACYQIRVWQKQFSIFPPLTISVNFSGKLFSQPNLVEQVESILWETGLDAHSLKLEITESVIMENTKPVNTTLSQLRALGIRVCLDDFGTGYSSLSYLHRFPIDTLKIDRSFVSNMSVGDEENSKILIVQTIIALAHNLGMDVIAEGVETVEQLTRLQKMRCKHAQGNYFSLPVDSNAAQALIAAQLQRI